METKEELKKVSAIIEDLLEKDERCRNDDKWLTIQVMSKFTRIYIPYEDLPKIPAFETIKRCRAKIQNKEGRFPPTDSEVIERRAKRSKDFKKWAYEDYF